MLVTTGLFQGPLVLFSGLGDRELFDGFLFFAGGQVYNKPHSKNTKQLSKGQT